MKYIYSVASGRISPWRRRSREALDLISKQDGFEGLHVMPDLRTLFFFDTRQNAIRAKNVMDSKGIPTGKNVCRFKVGDDGVPEFDEPEAEKWKG